MTGILKRWFNGHLTHVVTTALGLILAAAATGTWSMTIKLETVIERIENRDEQYQAQFEEHDKQLERLRRRLRWMERNRPMYLSIWDPR